MADTAQMFERKEYDVTNMLEKVLIPIFSCGFGFCVICKTQNLVLEPEEAVLTTKDMCSTSVQRRPYGELGSVDKATSCGCCIAVHSGLGPIQPGMGCEEALTSEIVEELKARMKTRGDTGNIQRAEQQIDMMNKMQKDVAHLNKKMDAIMAHLQIASPPPSPPPSPAVIERED